MSHVLSSPMTHIHSCVPVCAKSVAREVRLHVLNISCKRDKNQAGNPRCEKALGVGLTCLLQRKPVHVYRSPWDASFGVAWCKGARGAQPCQILCEWVTQPVRNRFKLRCWSVRADCQNFTQHHSNCIANNGRKKSDFLPDAQILFCKRS